MGDFRLFQKAIIVPRKAEGADLELRDYQSAVIVARQASGADLQFRSYQGAVIVVAPREDFEASAFIPAPQVVIIG